MFNKMSSMEGVLTFLLFGKHSDMINTIPKCLHSLIITVIVPNKRGQGQNTEKAGFLTQQIVT